MHRRGFFAGLVALVVAPKVAPLVAAAVRPLSVAEQYRLGKMGRLDYNFMYDGYVFHKDAFRWCSPVTLTDAEMVTRFANGNGAKIGCTIRIRKPARFTGQSVLQEAEQTIMKESLRALGDSLRVAHKVNRQFEPDFTRARIADL